MKAVRTNTERHTQWCAGGHHCAVALGEHRSDPVVLRVPGAGRAVLTRVQGGDGVEYAEVRMRVVLPGQEPQARLRLVALLRNLQTLVGPARRAAPTAQEHFRTVR